jgi:4-amino-4-deoxy-L-arabinose transferase-like glycosyltransferase
MNSTKSKRKSSVSRLPPTKLGGAARAPSRASVASRLASPLASSQWVWLGVVVVGFVAFFARSGHEPLWLDEIYSFSMVQHSVTDIFRLTTTDVHPPLYYVLLRFTTRLFGDSVFALRLPSVVAATALVALGAGPVRRLWNDKTAWVYVALVLTSSGILCFAQETRMYALAALCVTGAALYGHLAWRDGARRDYVAFGLFTWAASLMHYFALVAVGFNAVLLLAMAAFGSRERLKPLATTTGLAAVGFLPWAPFFFSQVASVARGFWIPPTSFELVTFGLVAPFAYKFEDVPYPWQAIAALAAFAFVVRAALVAQRREGVKTSASLQFLAVFGSTFGFGLVFSALIQPIFMPRYMIACSGVLFLVLAAAIAHWSTKLTVAATALFVFLGVPAWWRIQTQTFNGPFTELAVEVRSATNPVLVHNPLPFSFVLQPALHAVPEARHVVVVPSSSDYDATGGGLHVPPLPEPVENLSALLDTAERLWFVDGIPGPDPLDAIAVESDPRWMKSGPNVTLEQPMSWVKLTLRKYERRNP